MRFFSSVLVKSILSQIGQLKKLFEKDVHFIFYTFLFFYTLVFFNFNNKTFLLIILLTGFILFQKLKDLKSTSWLLYLLVLPFEKGKGFSFTLVPSYMTYGGFPYNFWFTITFTDLIFFFLIYLLVREKILSNWRVKKIKAKTQDFFIFGFLVIGFLTIFLSQFQSVSFFGFIRLARMIFAYFVARKVLQNEKVIKFTSLVLTSSLIFQGGWTTLQFFRQGLLGKDIEQIGEFYSPFGHLSSEDSALFRPSGTFVHPNTLACFAGTLLPFVLAQSLDKIFVKKEKYFLMTGLLVGGLGLLLSSSRAAWVTTFLILSLTVWFFHKRNRLRFPLPFKTWLLRFLGLLVVFLPILIFPRMTSLYQAFQKYGSAYYRMDLIKKAIGLSFKNPFGIGLETFPGILVNSWGRFFTAPAPIHNFFLQILVALGIPGLIFFLLILLLTYKFFFLNLKKEKQFFLKSGAFFASLSFLALGNFYPLFLVTNLSEYFWLFLSILSL